MRLTNTTLLTGSLLAALSIAGCSSSDNYASKHTVITTAEEQIAYGAEVFASNCAKCHGNSGQGTERAPMIVGNGALGDYRTAMDVAEFVIENMPPEEANDKSSELYYFQGAPRPNRNSKAARRKLTETEYWAVLSFALSANGVQLSEPVGAHNAKSIILNP